VNVSQSIAALTDSHDPPLSAPLTLAFDYTRSVGPTLGAFFTALRGRRIVGGELFDDFSDHPRKRVWIERYRVWSTAAGA